MKQLSVMIKPASSLCSMHCRYCFYTDVSTQRSQASFGMMSADTRRKMLDHIFSQLSGGDSITFVFQGGEPSMAGLEWFEQFVQEVEDRACKKLQISYAFQTNGINLDEDWLSFFREHHFLVGLSLDGPREFHDQNRPDFENHGTFSRIMRVKNLMDAMRIDYNVVSVLTNTAARHPKKIWDFLVRQQIRYVQFIPCLAPLDGSESLCSLTPQRYADFYRSIFDFWYEEARRGQARSVKLFDDLLSLLTSALPSACGINGQCQRQIVIEADGSVYPCDFYAIDQWKIGDIRTQDLRTLYESPKEVSFCGRPRQLPTQCGSCPYAPLCGGGCPRMRAEVFCSKKDGLCGHRLFLDDVMPRLLRLAGL